MYKPLRIIHGLVIAGVMTGATFSAATIQAASSADVKSPFHPIELNRVPNVTVWTDSTEIKRREWQLPTPKLKSQLNRRAKVAHRPHVVVAKRIFRPKTVRRLQSTPIRHTHTQPTPIHNYVYVRPVTPVASRTEPVRVPIGTAQQIGFQMMLARWPASEWPALRQLWERESGWNPNSFNPSSSACGIPQALPCSKISDHSVRGQIAWGLAYIADRYGSPSAAWAHSLQNNWY